MTASGASIAVAVALFATMAAYALFAGADLGAGIWDAVAGGTRRGRAPRAAVRRSVGPVWEANNVWIVFGLVIFWTAFPRAFAAVMTTLFAPLVLSLLGITLRGLGFAFRQETDRLPLKTLTTTIFAGSSVIAPFFLGTAVGAVTTGQVRATGSGDPLSAWTGPVPLVTGALFTTTCAFIGAVYLVRDCDRRGHEELSRYFARRAVAAGMCTGALAAVNLWLLHNDAPYVFGRLRHVAWPLVALSVLAGGASLVLVVSRHTRLVRPVAAVAVISVVAAWGWAQYPYLLPRSLTLRSGSSVASALHAQLVVVGMAVVLVAPLFGWLYWLQQHDKLGDGRASSKQLRQAVAAENDAARAAEIDKMTAGGARGTAVATAAIIVAVLIDNFSRAARSRRPQRSSNTEIPTER